jgi:CheY-like chemotaxis protein/HPt (histidine-containing phosphotransfer) domain-containing protein
VRPARETQPFGPLKILVAEDNRINQTVALGLLQRLGYRADIAANGLEVIEALSRIPYDVIFMDCQMPELDGYETTGRIRATQRANASRPYIIAMTAHAMAGDREKCLAAGMDDYLTKPINPADVREALQRAPGSAKRSILPPMANPASLQELAQLNTPDRPRAMAEIFQMFLEDAPPLLAKIDHGLNVRDTSAIERAAHKLSGSVSIFGANAIVAQCRVLQMAAANSDWTEAAKMNAELGQSFAALRQELESIIAANSATGPAPVT